MGFIRGAGIVIVSILFLVSLLAMNSCLTVYLSLDYENVQGEIETVFKEVIGEQINIDDVLEDNLEEMKIYCQNHSSFDFESGEELGLNGDIPCEIILQDKESILKYQLNSLAEEVYYQEYDCEFWNCFEKTEQPFFLISEKAQDYWKGKFYFSLIFVIIFAFLIFLLSENKASSFILGGILIIVSSLPFLVIKKIVGGLEESFLQFTTIFFTKSFFVFVNIFVLGALIIIVGILWKVFNVGVWLKEKFSKNE